VYCFIYTCMSYIFILRLMLQRHLLCKLVFRVGQEVIIKSLVSFLRYSVRSLLNIMIPVSL
jgi:hypothetical protein